MPSNLATNAAEIHHLFPLINPELLNLNIGLINSRSYRPQTNGKLERFHRGLEDEIWHYGNLDDYVKFYNERGMYFSLDVDIYETPLMAFYHKQATKDTREQNPD